MSHLERVLDHVEAATEAHCERLADEVGEDLGEVLDTIERLMGLRKTVRMAINAENDAKITDAAETAGAETAGQPAASPEPHVPINPTAY